MATVNFLYATGTEGIEGRSYTRYFQVIDTSADPNIIIQKQADGLPAYGAWYPTDGYSVCTSLSTTGKPDQVNDAGTRKYRWEVAARYEPRKTNRVPKDDPADPADPEKPRVSIGSAPREYVPLEDLDGEPIQNSAGDPFDPPPIEVEYDDALSVGVNIKNASFNIAATMAYRDSYNSANITICNYVIPQYAGLMRDILATPASRNGVDYWAVTFEILVTRKAGLWNELRIQDQGYNQLDAAGTATVKIRDRDKQPVQFPALLDGAGRKLALGLAPEVVTFRMKESKNWAALGLPTTSF